MLRLAIRDGPLSEANGPGCDAFPFRSREVVARRPLRTLEDTRLRELDYDEKCRRRKLRFLARGVEERPRDVEMRAQMALKGLRAGMSE